MNKHLSLTLLCSLTGFVVCLLMLAAPAKASASADASEDDVKITASRQFAEMDLNKDQIVNRDEFSGHYPDAPMRTFRQADEDRDKHIDLDEWTRFRSRQQITQRAFRLFFGACQQRLR